MTGFGSIVTVGRLSVDSLWFGLNFVLPLLGLLFLGLGVRQALRRREPSQQRRVALSGWATAVVGVGMLALQAALLPATPQAVGIALLVVSVLLLLGAVAVFAALTVGDLLRRSQE
jgi:hypothetical protein